LKKSLKFQVSAIIAVRIMLSTTMRMVYPFLPILARGIGVDLKMLTSAITLRSIIGMFSPLFATISDSKGRKTALLLGLVVFALGVGLMTIIPNFLGFTLFLVLTMIGIFIFLPSIQAYFGDIVPYNKRGTILAITEFSWSLSFIIGIPIIGFLIARSGWKAPFPFLTILALLAIVLIYWMIPADEAKTVHQPTLFHNLREVFTSPSALAGIAIAITALAANELVNVTFSTWMENAFSAKIATLSAVSVVIGISEMSGEASVSVLTDRIGKTRSVAIGLILNCLAILLLPFIGKNLVGAFLGLFLFYLTFEFMIVSCIPIITEAKPKARATMVAGFLAGTSLGRALGAFIAPYLFDIGDKAPYLSGMLAIAFGTILFNFLAIAALGYMKKTSEVSI